MFHFNQRAKFILFFLLILVSGSGWIWVSRPSVVEGHQTIKAEAIVGRPAPLFALTTLTGEHFDLAEQQGTPVLLNFWATWCGPCRAELPALQATAQQYAGQVKIVAVDQAETPAAVRRYAEELGLTFIIPMDTEGSVGNLYNIRGLPTTFFIDENGIIRQVRSGEMDRITLAESIASLLD
ncbi:MAG: redoxin domain-containing protein [Chloroflexota bacterium]